MYQYNNYAYSSGVPGSQNVAAYSTRQSAAAAAAAAAASTSSLYHPFTSSTTDDVGARRVDDAAAERDVTSMMTSPSSRRPTPGGASSADIVPPPPSTSTHRDRLTSPAARPAHLSNTPALQAGVPDGALHSSALDRVAVRVDTDDNDDDTRQQHSRSHSAPAAPHRRPAAADHRHSGPPHSTSPPMWYMQSVSPRTEAEHRLLMSPPPQPSAATPTPRDSTTTNVRHRRTLPLSEAELNGPVVDPCETDVAMRPNSVNLPAGSSSFGSCDPVLTRRRLRATRGRFNVYTAGDCGLASTLAGMAIVAGVALVFGVVGVQLLLRLTAASRRSATTHDDATTDTSKVSESLLPVATTKSENSGQTAITRIVVEEVAVALTAVTVALDLCCLLTVSMQCFFAVKLTYCRNAQSRFL